MSPLPTGLLLAATLLLPLGLAGAALAPRTRAAATALAPWAPLPGLVLAVWGSGAIAIPALVLGFHFTLDTTSRLFLGTTAVIWGLAALVGRQAGTLPDAAAQGRFLAFFLLTLAGNLGAVTATEAVTFYVFFGVLTVCAFGMIAADGRPDSRRAGRIYLSVALFGEILALAAFMLGTLGVAAGMIVALLVFGLGNKLGVLPLHVALPPAYAALRPAGGAVFAGPVVNAAAYGLIRFLPLGQDALPGLAGPVIVAGLVTAFGAGLLALSQAHPRALLGYSTASQMGILIVGLGVAAGLDGDWNQAMLPVTLFALHHAGVKSGLFLGSATGYGGGLLSGARVLLALSLVAVPLTGGALAKAWLEEEAAMLPAPWSAILHVALPLTSTVTVLYMARFLWLVELPGGLPARPSAPFLVLAAVALAAPWVAFLLLHPHPAELAFGPSHLWTAFWPVLTGAALVLLAVTAARWTGVGLPRLPPGDLAQPVGRALAHLAQPAGRALAHLARIQVPEAAPRGAWPVRPPTRVERLEDRLRHFPLLGGALVLLFVLLGVAATLLNAGLDAFVPRFNRWPGLRTAFRGRWGAEIRACFECRAARRGQAAARRGRGTPQGRQACGAHGRPGKGTAGT